MKCFLCGKTSIEAKIDLFPFNSAARKLLQKQFAIDSSEALAICRERSDLPGNLAKRAVKCEEDEHWRDPIKSALSNSRN